MDIKTTIETFYWHRVDRWMYLRRENTKRNLAYACVRWARRLGITAIPISSWDKAGYDIVCAMRGPDSYAGPLKAVFTARIRALVGVSHIALWRDNSNTLTGFALLPMETMLYLRKIDKQGAVTLLHWAEHNMDACLHFGNYPFDAARDVYSLIKSIARGNAVQGHYIEADRSLALLLEREQTHPDTCWQLPKEWR